MVVIAHGPWQQEIYTPETRCCGPYTNDKLYLNYDAEVQKKWVADKEKFIVEADMNWPDILN